MKSSPPTPSAAVAIFARAPVPGQAKTRLIPVLGGSGAAVLQAALIADAVRKVRALGRHAAGFLFLVGKLSQAHPIPQGLRMRPQRGRNLGARLENAFRSLLARHNQSVIIGTDSPTLPGRLIRTAIEELKVCDAVLGPCRDGGYYLVGLRRSRAVALSNLFRGVRWSTAFAFRDTLDNFLRRRMSCAVLEPWTDVDRALDLLRLRRELSRGAPRRQAPATRKFLTESGLRERNSASGEVVLATGARGPAKSTRRQGLRRRSKTPRPGRE